MEPVFHKTDNESLQLKSSLAKDHLTHQKNDSFHIKDGLTVFEGISEVLSKNLDVSNHSFKISNIQANYEMEDSSGSVVADTFHVSNEEYIKFDVRWKVLVQMENGEEKDLVFTQTLYTTVKCPKEKSDLGEALKLAYQATRCYELSQRLLLTTSVHEEDAKIAKTVNTLKFKPVRAPQKVKTPLINTSRKYREGFFKPMFLIEDQAIKKIHTIGYLNLNQSGSTLQLVVLRRDLSEIKKEFERLVNQTEKETKKDESPKEVYEDSVEHQLDHQEKRDLHQLESKTEKIIPKTLNPLYDIDEYDFDQDSNKLDRDSKDILSKE